VASNFPTSLDNFTNPASGNTLDSPSHSLQHSDINDAVEALEAKLGIGASPAGSAAAGQVLTISTAGTSTWSNPVQGLTQIVPTSVAVGSGSGSVTSTGAVTFSAASSVSLNDVFSATYDTYKIIIDVTKSTSLALILKLRVGGADNSSSLYQTQIQTYSNTTVGANRQTNTTSFQIGNTSDSPEFGVIEFLNPFAAKATAMSSKTNSTYSGTISSRYGDAGHNSTTSFDGFSVITSTGTITGTIRVYGYKN
jgi:hypothetical protein